MSLGSFIGGKDTLVIVVAAHFLPFTPVTVMSTTLSGGVHFFPFTRVLVILFPVTAHIQTHIALLVPTLVTLNLPQALSPGFQTLR